MVTETESGVIIDKREKSRLNISQGAKTKAMLVVALGIMAVIFVSTRKPAEGGTAAAPPLVEAAVADPKPMMAYAQRLMGLDQKTQQAQAPAVLQPPQPMQGRQDYGGGGYHGGYGSEPVVDPAIAERKKREYDSLFAPSVVKADDQERPAARQQPGQLAGLPPVPSVQEITRDVMAAMREASGQPAVAQAQAVSAAAQLPAQAATQPIQRPAGTHRVWEGTVIDGILANRLEGSMDGPVNALVSVPVYAQDLTLVIPAGARVLGAAKRVEAQGETRLAVAFHRVVLPNGTDISLDKFVGMGQVGDVGLRDKVNNHYLAIFGASAAVGVITGFSQWVGAGLGGGSGDRGGTVIIGSSTSDATAQVTARAMDRFLNRLPTIVIREGTRIRVYVTSDLDLVEYREVAR